jgi:predicted DNA-binding transcriptional regulator YafY
MNRAERFFKIHQLLASGTYPSMQRLTDTFGVTRSTINRDLDDMRTFMQAPIVYSRMQRGYHYDPAAPAFEMPGLWLSQAELHALLAIIRLLEGIQGGLLGDRVKPLKNRIHQLLGQGGFTAEAIMGRILLKPFAQRTLRLESFNAVAPAVLQGRMLAFCYNVRARGEESQRLVHPHRLVFYRDNWYLLAFCEQAQSLRLFSLDRLTDTALQEAPIQPCGTTSLDDYLEASFGIFGGATQAWAVLRFTSERARWVADECWHPQQVGRWLDDVYELRVPHADPLELILEILKYGPDVEVIAPESLRLEVIARLQAALARYR